MKTATIRKSLASVNYGDKFNVELKTGETVVCQCDPKKTRCEVAFQQTTANGTLSRGDILTAKEIAAIQ